MLNLMYITNDVNVALIAQEAGVQRIFIDMEYIGKDERQAGLDTVKSHHTVEDIKKIRKVIKKSEIIVRCNPIHESTDAYCSSQTEIEQILLEKPDIIMLPFFKTVAEVKTFLKLVNGRCKTMLLVETPEAVENIEEIIKLAGIDYIHIGLNDLSLGLKRKFMFEILADGTVDSIIEKIKPTGIPFGFGGIASLGKGVIPSEIIINEHYRLGSTCAILSRSFCDSSKYTDLNKLRSDFLKNLSKIRNYEKKISVDSINSNRELLKKYISDIKNGEII